MYQLVNTFTMVIYLGVVDGDTFRFTIPNAHPIYAEKIKVRLLGVDAPEKCRPKEHLKSKQYADKKIRAAKTITLANCQRGSFFRLICQVMLDGNDLGNDLLDKGLAVRYKRGRKKCPTTKD